MKTQDSFPFLLSSILGELEKASLIRIGCLPADETNKGNNGTVRKAASVNGLATPREFHDLIRHLKAEALMKFREVIPQIAPCDADAFIGLAQRRVRRMMRPVVAEVHQGRGARQEWQVNWSARHVRCFLGETETSDPAVVNPALEQTRRQARIFYLQMSGLAERIGSFAGAVVVPAAGVQPENSVKPAARIKLSCSVPFISALARVACDRNLFEQPNVSDLCRKIGATFSTGRQENLSAHSIRNHFDNPSPEVLAAVQMELRVWDKYIAALILRQTA